MTLIIAGIDADDGFMVGDSLLTTELQFNEEKNGESKEVHALKIQIINSSIAIGIAGMYDFGINCIAELSIKYANHNDCPPNIGFEFSQIVQRLASDKGVDVSKTEFLLLGLTQDNACLIKIENGLPRLYQRCFIGDLSAYNEVIKTRTPTTIPNLQMEQQLDGTFIQTSSKIAKIKNDALEISNAMRDYVAKRISTTVGMFGDIPIRITKALHSGKLEYMQEALTGTSPEEGNHGYSLLSSTDPYGIGIYFRSGRYGYVFKPADTKYCHRLNSENLAQFTSDVRRKFGLQLVGATWNEI